MQDSTPSPTKLNDLSQEQRDFLLKRGVAEIIPEKDFTDLLDSGRIARLKEGFDPSAPDIHLGHVVGLRKLRQLQEMGHKVILIVGNWTARIGDPSGQSTTRPMLTEAQIEANALTYMEQFFKVVDKNQTEVRWQTEWFSKFTLDTIIRLGARFTVAQILAREDFNKSTDQKFNCLLGRELQQMMGQNPQQVFFTPILIGTDGKNKMSKSLGNYIGVAEPPDQMYGKVMSLDDSMIVSYFELVTDVPQKEVDEIKHDIESTGANPMLAKKRLAHEITRQFHGSDAAAQAEEQFTRVHQQHQLPSDIPEIQCDGQPLGEGRFSIQLSHHLVQKGFVSSNSELRRLVAQNAVEVDGQKISEMTATIKDGSVVKVGKRTFVKIRVN